MATDNDISEFLQVGNMALFQSGLQTDAASQIRTTILGWQADAYVFLERPKIRERFCPLSEGMPCVIRFIREGAACGFVSKVMDWCNRESNSWCRVAWPDEVHRVGFRRHSRVEAVIPCSFTVEEGKAVTGEIRDISTGGCRIATETNVEPGKLIKLSFTLAGCGPLRELEAVVRRVEAEKFPLSLGCEFSDGQEHAKSEIAFFVTCKKNIHYDPASIRPRVLVIDHDHGNCSRLWQAFYERGYEVITANSTMDGIHRLHLLRPLGLVVAHALQDMPGVDVCRMVRASSEFENMRIVLYGKETGDAANPCNPGESIQYIPSADAADAICDAILKSAPGEPQGQ